VVDPNGEIVAEASSEADEVITADVDFDACRFGKTTVFDFARHRRIEHYGRITAQGGAEPPGES
jgi:predicted amidohydrolase